MTYDVRQLVAMLAAAFPHPPMPDATFELYVHHLGQLREPATLREAIEALIVDPSVEFLPRIGRILEAYWERARVLHEVRETEDRIRAAEFAETHGLPAAGGWKDANPIPTDTVKFLQRKWGIDVTHLIKHIDDAA